MYTAMTVTLTILAGLYISDIIYNRLCIDCECIFLCVHVFVPMLIFVKAETLRYCTLHTNVKNSID